MYTGVRMYVGGRVDKHRRLSKEVENAEGPLYARAKESEEKKDWECWPIVCI